MTIRISIHPNTYSEDRMINLYLSDLQHMDMEDVVAEVMTEYVQLSQEVKTLRATIEKFRWLYMRNYVKPEGNVDTDMSALLDITEVDDGDTTTYYVAGAKFNA